MPIYEYCCQECRHIFEEWQKDFTERDMTCPICGGQAKRLISNTAFILKGSGWYVTDYARSSSSCGKENGNGAKEKEDVTSEKSDTTETAKSKDTESDKAKTATDSNAATSSSSSSGTEKSSASQGESK